jgi:hypothetical protein
MALHVVTWKVYSLECDCGTELPNPTDGSMNWDPQGCESYGQTVTCHVCGKTQKLPKALRS